jgi:16S rRNA (cytosine1402-N4)-methyltransferase
MMTHIPVLLQQVLSALDVQVDQWYIDGTFGRGGHTAAILEKGGKVVAFDCDEEAIHFGEENFQKEIKEGRLQLIRENFDKLTQAGHDKDFYGVLFDFGVSSPQIDGSERGFSFQHPAELDMRMDSRLGVKAKDLLALLSEKQLSGIFTEFGGEHEAWKIAKAIVYARSQQPFETTTQLADFIASVKKEKRGRLHPATKVFQALRITVNQELSSIKDALPQAYELLVNNGQIVTISFHEGEDRIVKQMFREWEKMGKGTQPVKQVIVPTDTEIEENPRARSAKMRIFKKYEQHQN